jgi:exonuclease III
LLNDSVPTIRKLEYECSSLEKISVELRLNNLKILLITVHLPTSPPPINNSHYNFIVSLLSITEHSDENYDEIIIIGDMNTDYMSDSNENLKSNARYLNDIFLHHKMQQIVKEKTYPQNNVDSVSQPIRRKPIRRKTNSAKTYLAKGVSAKILKCFLHAIYEF